MNIRYILFLFFAAAVIASCGKKEDPQPGPDPQPQLSAFAQHLKATCTTPFKGAGDTAGVYLPTAISPNGDGNNDVYGLMPTPLDFSAMSLSVYDTTGLLVFHTDTASGIMWDGIDKNTGSLAIKNKYYVKIAYTTTGNITDSGGTYLYVLTTSPNGCVGNIYADTAYYLFPNQFVFGTGFVRSYSPYEPFCY